MGLVARVVLEPWEAPCNHSLQPTAPSGARKQRRFCNQCGFQGRGITANPARRLSSMPLVRQTLVQF